MNSIELKSFLDDKVAQYNKPDFIESDPIQIPHLFTKKEDIEISGFLTATIAWGNRKMIIKNAHKIMELLGDSPYDFVMSYSEKDLLHLQSFVHRTFNGSDLTEFIVGLGRVYKFHGGLEATFAGNSVEGIYNISVQNRISNFKKIFFETNLGTDSSKTSLRAHKHVSDPQKGSAAKRINMFLRWMCRKDQAGVDLGIWSSISASELSCPLDVHSGNVARKLNLLIRKQNDAKAVSELDITLRAFDSLDPVKYDFALFGLGVFEGF